MRLRVGSRRSPLARAQAHEVVRLLAEAIPELEVEWVWMRTQGDRLQGRPLREFGGKALFVKELEEALLAGTLDLAVHSGKDLPAQLPPGLMVAATPLRASPYDLLLAREPCDPRKPLRIGTSSLRREIQIRRTHPHWQVESLRGNLDTRWQRVREGRLDLIAVAEAGVRRLFGTPPGYAQRPEWMIPAPCQGILAVEIREDREDLKELLGRIHDPLTGIAFQTERRVMELVGGGCLLPFACLATFPEENRIQLLAALWDGEGKEERRFQGDAPREEALSLAERAAAELLKGGALPRSLPGG